MYKPDNPRRPEAGEVHRGAEAFVSPEALPLGAARLIRPSSVRRIRFDDFIRPPGRSDNVSGMLRRLAVGGTLPVVPIEAVTSGDDQVLAAREPGKGNSPLIDLDVLAGFPSAESIIASTITKATRELPAIREVIMCGHQPSMDTATLAKFTGLGSLVIRFFSCNAGLDLGCLPASWMRQLAVSRWDVESLAPLGQMITLRQLEIECFRASLQPLSNLHDLTHLKVIGEAKAWSSLRECTQLEQVSLHDVQMASMKRWNTWQRLRTALLGGRGLKSLAGIEACQQLQSLFLGNFRTGDLSPLRELPDLTDLTLGVPDRVVDLISVVRVRALRRLEIDGAAVTDIEVVNLPTLKPLSAAPALEEITLVGTRIGDRDLTPLAAIERLRRVRLDCEIGCDVERLRTARPDLTIDYTPPFGPSRKFEKVGQVNIYAPGKRDEAVVDLRERVTHVAHGHQPRC
jgi:hypothetical protein